MKLKLDLHTHVLEAMNLRVPTLEAVAKIVSQVKAAGLDGIAVTEHWNKEGGLRVKELVEEHFPNQILIIPGQEIDLYPEEVVELYLPNGAIFRFLAHPGYLGGPVSFIDGIQGVEIDNGMHNWHINKQQVREMAEQHGLLLLRNSDAHYMEKVGLYYNEIELEELMARASQE